MTNPLPKGWQYVTLQDVAEDLDSKRIPVEKGKRVRGQIPYYGATGIVDYVDDFIFDEDILLVGEDGADWSPFANTAFIASGRSWVNNHAHVLRVHHGVNMIFLKEVLNLYDLEVYTSGSTRRKLNKADLMQIKLLMPSTPSEQDKIAAVFTGVNAMLIATQKVIDQTEQLKKHLIQQLLTRGINHGKFARSMLGEIPNSWEVQPISKLVELVIDHRGKTPTKLGGSWCSVGTPAISAMNVKGNKIIKPETFKFVDDRLYAKWMKRELKGGDLLLTSEAPMGEMYIIKNGEKYCLSQRLFALRFTDTIMPEFFYYFFGSSTGQKQLDVRKSGSTAQGIRQSELMKVLVPVPPLGEQRTIVGLLSSLDAKIDAHRRIKAKQEKLMRGLMQDLLTGKVRV